MKLKSEYDLLKPEVRIQLIREITDRENIERKQEALRRHEIYRDKNRKWVVAALANEGYKPETLAQMQNRASNISICRRITNKLARTYVGGVIRKAESEGDQKSVDDLAKALNFNTSQKKFDRYRQLFKNTTTACLPVRSARETRDDGQPLYDLKMKVFAPWQYDVVEDAADPTRAMCYILTDFVEREQYRIMSEPYARAAEGYRDPGVPFQQGDGKDQMIADRPEDRGKEKREFIFWTAHLHFACDDKSNILPEKSGENNQNPIGILPFRDVHDDQDCNYWAEGGDDVVEGSILINKLLTDGNYISFVQGWGQLVISAPEIPKKLVGGPDNAFVFETKPDMPLPDVFFATSNPDISKWLEATSTHLAMLLTTNGLSPRTVSTKLDAANMASGIAMLIENSDVDEETQDTQTLYQEAEPDEWEIVSAWQQLYGERKLLTKKFAEIAVLKAPLKITVKFLQVAPPITETEKLNALKTRKEIGLDSMKDLIKRDNPGMTDEELDAKVEELKAEKKANAPEPGENPAFGKPGGPDAKAKAQAEEDAD